METQKTNSPKFLREHKKGKGIHLTRGDKSVDILVLDVYGPEDRKEALLEINIDGKITRPYLRWQGSPVPIIDDISVGINPGRTRSSSNRIPLVYFNITPEDKITYI